MKRTSALLTISLLVLASSAAVADEPGHGHEHEDMLIGYTDYGNVSGPFDLIIEFGHDNEEFDEEHILPPVSGPLNGWAGDAPGFDVRDEIEEDMYPLQAGANIDMELTAIDAGLRIFTPGFTQELFVGNTFNLGDHQAHEHVEFFIDADQGADPTSQFYAVSFKLLDTGTTAYGASPVYTLKFVPEPGSLLLLLGAVAALRRR
jgi:hypothetical protein